MYVDSSLNTCYNHIYISFQLQQLCKRQHFKVLLPILTHTVQKEEQIQHMECDRYINCIIHTNKRMKLSKLQKTDWNWSDLFLPFVGHKVCLPLINFLASECWKFFICHYMPLCAGIICNYTTMPAFRFAVSVKPTHNKFS